MAKLLNSAVVLRFRLGTGLVKARQRYANTSRAILERVTLQYAEGMYDEFRKEVQEQIEKDVRVELQHVAGLFRRHIIGFSGRRSTPSGTLSVISKGLGAPSAPIASMLPAWKARNKEYLRSKRSAIGNIGWFDNTGWPANGPDLRFARVQEKAGSGPIRPGLLRETFTRDAWETIFGPISVQFFKARKLEATDSVANIGAKGSRLKVQIGSIYVRAIGKITPAMLPGYTSGRLMASSSGNKGLLDVIGAVPGGGTQLAYRLGVMRNGVYRPTLEPFLGFFLTKSIPFVVARRLGKGNLGSIQIKP